MNITVTSLAASVALPALMAVCLTWGSRRGGFRSALASVFLLGGFSSFVLAMGMSRLLLPVESIVADDPQSVRAGLASAFLTAALSEELARVVTSICFVLFLRESAGRAVILTCGTIGLGFAMFENLLYSLTSPTALDVMIGRAVPTLFHGTTALIMGSFLERAFSAGHRIRFGPLLLALSVPILLHGLYDFGAFLFEVIELPDLPEEPSMSDLKPLGSALGTMLLVSSIGLIELIWVGRIVLAMRKTSATR